MRELGITQKPDGSYVVRIVKAIRNPTTDKREDIVRKRSRIRTRGEARYIQAQLIAEVHEEAQLRLGGVSTVEQAIALFLELRGKQFSPSSLMGMKQNLDRYLEPIKSVHVTKVTRAQMEDLLRKHVDRIAPATLDRVTTNIRSLFRFLMERGALKENPVQFIRFGTKKTYDRKLSAMSQAEIQKLLTGCQSHPFYPIFFVAYHTGARSGELVELKFSDFDFENNTLTISRSRCKKTKTVTPPKSGRSRAFHVNSDLIGLIKALKLKSNGCEFVLPREKQFLRGEAAKVLKALQDELGIQRTNFHSIRASFITHLLLAGTPITTVQAIVGHADLKTTQQYVRLCGSDLVGATDCLQKNSPRISGATKIIQFPASQS